MANGFKAERKLADKLDDDDESEEMSVRELISIARDAADRVGLSKRAIQTNVSIDFASLLDRAIKRSSMEPPSGDLKLVPHIPQQTLDGGPPVAGAAATENPNPIAAHLGATKPTVKLVRRI
jgi:hypothetical protein